MVGVVLPLYPRTQLDLNQMVATDPTTIAPVTTLRAIPVASWTSVGIGVRVYANGLTSGQAVHVQLLRSAPDPEAPDDDFIGSALADITISSGTPAPMLLESSIGVVRSSHLDLVISLHFGIIAGPDSAAGTAGTVTIDAELWLRGRFMDVVGWAEFDARGQAVRWCPASQLMRA